MRFLVGVAIVIFTFVKVSRAMTKMDAHLAARVRGVIMLRVILANGFGALPLLVQ